MNTTCTLPAGHYIIADPCYIVSDAVWDEFCNISDDWHDGLYELRGHKLAVFRTGCGDGDFRAHKPELGIFTISVDSGTVGAVPIELCKNTEEGVEYITAEDFTCDRDGDTVFLGEVTIDTYEPIDYGEYED